LVLVTVFVNYFRMHLRTGAWDTVTREVWGAKRRNKDDNLTFEQLVGSVDLSMYSQLGDLL
jgi:hypothetical protein